MLKEAPSVAPTAETGWASVAPVLAGCDLSGAVCRLRFAGSGCLVRWRVDSVMQRDVPWGHAEVAAELVADGDHHPMRELRRAGEGLCISQDRKDQARNLVGCWWSRTGVPQLRPHLLDKEVAGRATATKRPLPALPRSPHLTGRPDTGIVSADFWPGTCNRAATDPL